MAKEFVKQLNLLDKICDKQLARMTKIKVSKGETIYNQGDSPKGLYYIKKGYVGLLTISTNGNESLLRVFNSEQIFGHRSIISDETYHASAVALTDCELTFITKENFDMMISENSDVLLVITKVLAKELRRAENKFMGLATTKVSQRIIQTLAFLRTRFPDYKWTRREIGEYCGAKTETVSRVLGELEKAKLIEKDGRVINIIDLDKLLQYAEDCCDSQS